jgi:hypothetical protein
VPFVDALPDPNPGTEVVFVGLLMIVVNYVQILIEEQIVTDRVVVMVGLPWASIAV